MTNDPGEPSDDGGSNPFKGTPFEQIFNAFGAQPVRAPRGAGWRGDARPVRADGPDAGDDDAARRIGELDTRQGRRPAHRRREPRPLGHREAAQRGGRRPAAGRPLAGLGDGAPVRRDRLGGVEPRRVGRADHRRLAGPRRAGRRARRVSHGQRSPAGSTGDGRAADGHPRPGRRRDVRQPGRSGARRPGRRGAHRLRHRPASRPERAGRAAARQRGAFADGLDVDADDVLLYLALREAAHQRLFAHVPWLRGHLVAAVEDYGRGTTDRHVQDRGRPCAASTRRTRPRSRRRWRAASSSRRRPPPSRPHSSAWRPRSRSSRAGSTRWSARPPRLGCPAPASSRRRSAGGARLAAPPSPTFAALVGLELRPRRLRDASDAVGLAAHPQGTAEARDAVWAHPDLLPTAADLDDPLGFRRARCRRPSR